MWGNNIRVGCTCGRLETFLKHLKWVYAIIEGFQWPLPSNMGCGDWERVYSSYCSPKTLQTRREGPDIIHYLVSDQVLVYIERFQVYRSRDWSKVESYSHIPYRPHHPTALSSRDSQLRTNHLLLIHSTFRFSNNHYKYPGNYVTNYRSSPPQCIICLEIQYYAQIICY